MSCIEEPLIYQSTRIVIEHEMSKRKSTKCEYFSHVRERERKIKTSSCTKVFICVSICKDRASVRLEAKS